MRHQKKHQVPPHAATNDPATPPLDIPSNLKIEISQNM